MKLKKMRIRTPLFIKKAVAPFNGYWNELAQLIAQALLWSITPARDFHVLNCLLVGFWCGMILQKWMNKKLSHMDDSLRMLRDKYMVGQEIPMLHGQPLLEHHARGQMSNGHKFVYCPAGQIVSWSPEDYDHEFCAWCKMDFGQLEMVKVMRRSVIT